MLKASHFYRGFLEISEEKKIIENATKQLQCTEREKEQIDSESEYTANHMVVS